MEDFHKRQLGKMLEQNESLKEQLRLTNLKIQNLLDENTDEERATWLQEIKEQRERISGLEKESKKMDSHYKAEISTLTKEKNFAITDYSQSSSN